MNRSMNRRRSDRKAVPLKTMLFDVFAGVPPVIGLLSIVLLFINYVFWWPINPAFQIDKPESHSIEYERGTILVHRSHCADDLDMPVTITHDLVRVPDAQYEPELRITLPRTVQVYRTGCKAVDRLFEVPSFVPAGHYRLASTATWQANPFRIGVARLPDLPVDIPVR